MFPVNWFHMKSLLEISRIADYISIKPRTLPWNFHTINNCKMLFILQNFKMGQFSQSRGKTSWKIHTKQLPSWKLPNRRCLLVSIFRKACSLTIWGNRMSRQQVEFTQKEHTVPWRADSHQYCQPYPNKKLLSSLTCMDLHCSSFADASQDHVGWFSQPAGHLLHVAEMLLVKGRSMIDQAYYRTGITKTIIIWL